MAAYHKAANNNEGKKIILFARGNKRSQENEILFTGHLEYKDLYRVDLSVVISKYKDETEKSLAQIFNTTVNKNWLLFFDESDALFDKRSDAESIVGYIHNLSEKKNVTVIFYCKENCPSTFQKDQVCIS